MKAQLVVGPGLIGTEVSRQLLARDDDVTVASRSGRTVPGARSVRLDASDATTFAREAEGKSTIFLVTNPSYSTWPTAWPPVFAAAIAAAETSGAALVVMGNLYPYGSPTAPMNEKTPESTTETKGLVRKDGWAAVKRADAEGRIRAVEVRASDYFGPGAQGSTAHLGSPFFESVLDSKTARVVGGNTTSHSWSYIPDIAATLIAASDYDGQWGRVWHVPSNGPKSRSEIAAELNAGFGTNGRTTSWPQWTLRAMGLFSPTMREIYASSYQFVVPFVIDSIQTERELGVRATPWSEALETTALSYRPGLARAS